MELECVFFSVTPTFNNRSRITLLLTSSSLAKSLIRTLCCIPPYFLRIVPCAYAFMASSRCGLLSAVVPRPGSSVNAGRAPRHLELTHLIAARRATLRPARSHLQLQAARGYGLQPHRRVVRSPLRPLPRLRNTDPRRRVPRRILR